MASKRTFPLFYSPESMIKSSKTLLLAILWTASTVLANDEPRKKVDIADAPFEVGERIEYSLSWGVFNVGRGVLEVHPMVEVEGELCWHFSLTVRTNRFADAFYRVRSRFDSYVAADMSGTVHYTKRQREGRSERDIVVTFDRGNKTAQYSDRGVKEEPIEITYPIFDPVGLVYYFRYQRPGPDTSVRLNGTDGKRTMSILAEVIGKERIRVPAGRFWTFFLEPDTGEMEGVFEQSDDNSVRLWFEDRPPHRPIQVSGKVTVGHFWAKLGDD